MNRPYRASAALALLLLIGVLLAGCALPFGLQPTPTPYRGPLTFLSSPTPDPAAPPPTATPMPTPVLPMATPYATPRPEAGVFIDAEIGLQFDYPFYWNRSSGAVPGTLVQIANQANNVFVLILRTSLPTDEPLESAAREVHAQIAEWLGGLDTIESKATQRADDLAGWTTEYRRNYAEYNVTVRSLVTSLAHGKQLITFAAYGEEQPFTTERATVEQILASVKLNEPQIYGIPRSQVFITMGQDSANPRDNDPATGPGDRRIFSGLVTFDPQLALQPDLAASWDISPDGTVYTFYLRPSARFHDGRAVTAHDVVYSWERAADPATESDTVLTYLGDIVGVAEKRAGTATMISGLKVIDDYTLQVTIVAPRPYFLLKLTGSPALILDRTNVAMGPEWYRTPNGSGPYRLISWEPRRVKIYQRNDAFYLEAPRLPYIVVRLDVGWRGLHLYTLEELDQVELQSYELNYLRESADPLMADLHVAAQMCTSFVSFDTSKPPFDDPKVRQAFALAVDRQRYQDRVLQGSSSVARGLYPPALPGYNPDFAGLTFDANLARQRLAESRYASEGLPPIVLSSSGYGLEVEPGIGVLVQMWQETLGANITIDKLEPTRYSESVLGSERGNLFFWSWCADYPDPEHFADALFHSRAQQNIGRYSNPELDALLEQARSEADVARRLALYQQAEQIIVADAAAIFLNHDMSYLLLNPRVRGFAALPRTVPIERYMSLEAVR